ncbi:MAG: 50S ribosomal protein L29 [Alphaproteobacteria bacterium]
MATVKSKDLRLKTDKELEEQRIGLKKERFNLRFQKATGQLTHTDRQRQARREIAKIETILTERSRKAKSAA